jgi:hypothetical protein
MTAKLTSRFRLRSDLTYLVDAVQLPAGNDDDDDEIWGRAAAWCGSEIVNSSISVGDDTAVAGDWIVRQPRGFVVWPPEGFAEWFEAVTR